MKKDNATAILDKVTQFMLSKDMTHSGGKICVAVSGGADSMALLYTLKAVGFENIMVAHINHGIRGESADNDALFVKRYCNEMGIHCKVFDANTDDTVYVPSNASEDWARQLRYGYLDTLVKEGYTVATAHTMSDQAETLMYRAAKGGAGLTGMRGIPAVRGNYIRPFLCITRADVMELIKHYGIDHIEDETNATDDYARNMIRHHVISTLKRINPKAEQAISKLSEKISDAQDFINNTVDIVMDHAVVGSTGRNVLYTENIIGHHKVIVEGVARQLLEQVGSVTEYNIGRLVEFLDLALHSTKLSGYTDVRLGTLNCSNGGRIIIGSKKIVVYREASLDDRVPVVGYNIFGEHGFNVNIRNIAKGQLIPEYQKDNRTLHKNAVFTDLDINKCTLRKRRDGDRFTDRRGNNYTVAKWLSNMEICESLRDSVPLLEYEGKIIWLWGLGFSNTIRDIGPADENVTERIYYFETN